MKAAHGVEVRRKRVAVTCLQLRDKLLELPALRWDDIDFENLEIRVTEAIWHQVVGDCKTDIG